MYLSKVVCIHKLSVRSRPSTMLTFLLALVQAGTQAYPVDRKFEMVLKLKLKNSSKYLIGIFGEIYSVIFCIILSAWKKLVSLVKETILVKLKCLTGSIHCWGNIMVNRMIPAVFHLPHLSLTQHSMFFGFPHFLIVLDTSWINAKSVT